MSIEGQGYFFTIYFPGFVCFVLYLDKISGECLTDICVGIHFTPTNKVPLFGKYGQWEAISLLKHAYFNVKQA